jgi:polyphosphate kinase 2 (PPK2 family)
LQRRLYDLEKACWDNKVPSMLVFEGWDAAGKGSSIAELTARLDPRGFKLHAIQPPRTYERNRPWLWRFWMRTPNQGEMAIFDQSWYEHVLEERVRGDVSKGQCQAAYRDIVEFERMLAEDGMAIAKFWLHISRKEQKARFRALEKDPFESWRITRADWQRHRKYKQYLRAAEEMFEQTDSEFAPWTIVEATSKWYARRKIFETAIRALETRLGAAAPVPAKVETERDAQLRDAVEKATQVRSKKAR